MTIARTPASAWRRMAPSASPHRHHSTTNPLMCPLHDRQYSSIRPPYERRRRRQRRQPDSDNDRIDKPTEDRQQEKRQLQQQKTSCTRDRRNIVCMQIDARSALVSRPTTDGNLKNGTYRTRYRICTHQTPQRPRPTNTQRRRLPRWHQRYEVARVMPSRS